MLLHFSSNSSNQSDQSLPTKIAKLEARMVGKAPSAAPAPAQATWPAALCVAKYGVAATAENLSESLPSSDSDDDVKLEFCLFIWISDDALTIDLYVSVHACNGTAYLIQANTQKRRKLEEDDNSSASEHVENGTAYLIQANTQKRRKLEEDDNSSASEHVEAVADIGQKVVETTDPKPGVDVNRRRQGRGRGHAASGRGRGSRVNGQAKTQTSPPINSPSNGQLINSHHKKLSFQDRLSCGTCGGSACSKL
ncbi:hypothetical protein TEA_017999 [Camellia sinensis var. sinensis]|uniref:Uncharacterized protein n=1 Tax=Camellia sinensis var. sinensis TaxID=542762 RepID=A0A4S4END0_CAMSN|nr:hypothetical protein TEA_017999 [Camellia sinensis var. sinensis]